MTAVCPLVGRPTKLTETPYSQGAYRVVRCEETGFVFLENPPEYKEVRDDFPFEVTVELERQRRKQAEPVMARLSAVAKQAKQWLFPKRNHMHKLAAMAAKRLAPNREIRLLDIGCGCGGLAVDCCTRFAKAGRSATPIGIELSPTLAQGADRQFQAWSGHVIEAPALDATREIEAGTIDVALLASFLEHDRRPLELLQALRPALADDGCAIIKVPNFASLNRHLRGRRWCGFRFPDHVNYFTPSTLTRLAHEAGYTVDAPTWGDRQPLSDNMYAVLRPIKPSLASRRAA